jgi:purine-nucleoside phosphorylase
VVTLPTRVLVEWGVPNLFVTNAAGGLNRSFKVGDLMVLTGYRDMLNPKHKETGLLAAVKVPVVNSANSLTDHLLKTGEKLSAGGNFRALQKGTYAALLGPTYETLAEIEMLKKLQADAVGMSTAPELETVKGTGTRAAAVSVVTNVWSPDEAIGGHEEVLHAAKEASQRLDVLFRTAIENLPQ